MRPTTALASAPLLRPAEPRDAGAIADIHAAGLATGHASFRERPFAWEELASGSAPGCLLVAEAGGEVLGWASVSPTSDRCSYAGVGEVSLYVGEAARGRGVGRALLAALVAASEAAGFWTLMAQIFPENRASLALFAAGGFRTVGRRERLGRMGHGPMAGHWRDVTLLERRSATIGADGPAPIPA